MKDETKKVSKNRAKKEIVVNALTEKVNRAKAIIFTGYQGMTHIQLEQLKKSLKKLNTELVVAKNSLLSIAIKHHNTKPLEGATATLFAYDDIVLPIKEIAKLIKTIKLPTIKFGIVEGKLLAENDVIRLSTLPSRDMLIAQLVGGLKSPIYGLHRALNWNIQKLVMTLSAIQQKKV